MNNLLKLGIIALSLCLLTSLSSCSKGGTIIIKNNYSNDKEVTIYSDFKEPDNFGSFNYRDKYGLKNINIGSTCTFNVNTNATYGIVWRGTDYDYHKTVEVSNGEVVKISIP
jgi:hypothetical protein